MAHVYAARAVLPSMIARGEGYLLTTASAAGLLTQMDSVIYAMTKHAAVALAEWLAINHHHQGIRVSTLCPQAVRTNIMGNARPNNNSVRQASADGVLEPAQLAQTVIEALAEERFWVLPHQDWMGMATARWDRVAEGVNPSLGGDIPGIPPMEQIVAEMAALAEQPEG